jgi:hypothetical protein
MLMFVTPASPFCSSCWPWQPALYPLAAPPASIQ